MENRSIRWACGAVAVVVVSMVAELRAAFELKIELPAAYAGAVVSVGRESLETREATAVAQGKLANGRGKVRVDAPMGLFTVTVGEAEEGFVASDGQVLRVGPSSDGHGLRVEGSADQEKFERYEARRKESLARLVLPVRAQITARNEAGDEAAVARLTEREVAAYREHRHELNDFSITQLEGSPALYAASLRWDGDYRLEELAAVVAEFAQKFPEHDIARMMVERIARFRVTAVGAVAPELGGVGPDGAATSLAALRGRVVLVDFWASWCGPCRVENRNYSELYRQFREAGFEIFAVSVDQEVRSWKAAIAKDGAGWVHLSDLRGWKSPLAARYNVSALPASFLLDREGRIIAKDVRGKQLAALLAETLKAGR